MRLAMTMLLLVLLLVLLLSLIFLLLLPRERVLVVDLVVMKVKSFWRSIDERRAMELSYRRLFFPVFFDS
jgi:hypothetical protein